MLQKDVDEKVELTEELRKELAKLHRFLKEGEKQNNLTTKILIGLKIKYVQENKNKGCTKCGKKDKLTLDHIIPQSLLENFGINNKTHWDEENCQVLCQYCNKFKSDRLDFTNPKTKQLLLKYINKVN